MGAPMIPEFTMGNAAVDFSPISNALARWQQSRQQDRAFGLQEKRFAQQDKQWAASNALAQAQFGLAQRTANRADELAPGQLDLQKAQIDAQRAHIAHLASQGAQEAELRPYKVQHLQSQSEFEKARAEYYKAKSQPAPAVRQPNLGMREDGTVYDLDAQPDNTITGGSGIGRPGGGSGADDLRMPPVPPQLNPGYASDGRTGSFASPRVGANVLAGSASDPGSVSVRKEDPNYGRYDVTTPDVPGLVTRPNPSRTSDKYGTQVYQGQRSVDKVQADADRSRMLEWRSVQDRWSYLHGKPPPAGYQYNPDGSLRDLKDESKKALGRDKIAALMDDVAVASDVFKDSWYPGRAAAAATGGWINPKYEQASRSVEHAVQFLTAEIEGKRHANAQDVRMLKFFSPDLGKDSQEMIGFKLDQLNRIMSNYFGAKTPSGGLFRSELAKANAAYHQAIKDGRIEQAPATTRAPPSAGPSPTGTIIPQGASPSPDGWITLPNGMRIREKR